MPLFIYLAFFTKNQGREVEHGTRVYVFLILYEFLRNWNLGIDSNYQMLPVYVCNSC